MLTSMSETVPTDSQNRLGGRSDDDELDADYGQLRVKWLKSQHWKRKETSAKTGKVNQISAGNTLREKN